MSTADVTARAPERQRDDRPLLAVDDLAVTFLRRGAAPLHAVSDVSFTVRPGEHVGLVGESGSGKSVTSLAIMGLLPSAGVDVSGRVDYDGDDLLDMDPERRRALRGREIAMVFQDPMTSLNPVLRIGLQIAEVVQRHRGLDKTEAMDAASDLLSTAVAPTFEEIGKLAAVAAIRTALNFFLAREIREEREEVEQDRERRR